MVIVAVFGQKRSQKETRRLALCFRPSPNASPKSFIGDRPIDGPSKGGHWWEAEQMLTEDESCGDS